MHAHAITRGFFRRAKTSQIEMHHRLAISIRTHNAHESDTVLSCNICVCIHFIQSFVLFIFLRSNGNVSSKYNFPPLIQSACRICFHQTFFWEAAGRLSFSN